MLAAIRAAQLGLNTVCIEMDKTLGGTCVNVGCIPSKRCSTSSEHYEFARLHAAEHGVTIGDVKLDLPTMMKRKDSVVGQNTKGIEFLFRKNKITWAKGRGTLKKGNVVDVAGTDGKAESYRAKSVIIATGSVPVELPFLKFDEKRVLSNIGALTIPVVPKHLLVIGGGVIGLELGSVWRRLGAKVTVVELMPTILPGNDERSSRSDKVFRRQGLDIRVGSKVTVPSSKRIGFWWMSRRLDSRRRLMRTTFWYPLAVSPRSPDRRGGLGFEARKAREIAVDAQLRTNLPNVYAIGDAVGGKLLAHKAEEEGVIAAEVIAGHKVHMDYKSMPSVVYTWPEIATVGLAEHEVKESGRKYKTGKFPFTANARARTSGETSGFIKFIADAETDELLGCHMIGANVSEMIQEAVLAFEFRGSSEDIGITVHSHPTLTEAVKEAALGVLGRSIHI